MERRVAASVALTSVAQIATMALGGVLAILVAAEFGSDSRTDGFFAAYGVYAVVILLAQSVRVTVVPRLVEGEAGGSDAVSFEAFNRFFAAVLVSVALFGVVFVALGDPLASLLTADDEAQSTARTALAILWPAASLQLFAALAAAMLGVLGDFVMAAVSYAVGGISSIAAFLVLEGSLGIDALPVAVLIGAGVTAVPLAVALAAAGWRPALADLRGSTRRAGVLGLSSPPMVLMQFMYLISIAFAAGLGEGAVTIFSYAFFGLGLLIALVASSIPIVFAAPLAATWDRNPASLRPHVDDVFRTGLMVLVPAVAAAALIGDDVGRVLLAEFSDAEVERTVRTFLVLSGSAIVAEALAIPVTALLTLGRYGAMALISLPVLGAYAALSAIAAGTDSVYWLAAVLPACLLGFALAMLALLHGREWPRVAGRLGWEVVRMAAPAAPFAVAAAAFSGISDWVAYAAGLGGYVLSIAAYMPAHRSLAQRLVASIRASAAAGRV